MVVERGKELAFHALGGRELLGGKEFRWKGAWGSVAILMLLSLLSITDRQIIALMVDPIKHDLGLSDTEVGLLQGLAFALFYGVAGIPIGWAVDRFSRRTIVFIGIVFWSLSACSCGLARNFGQLFAGRSLVGAGEATLGPTAVSLISDIFPRGRVATPLGVYSAGFYLGSGVALGVGGLIVNALLRHPSVMLPLIGRVAPWQAVFIITSLPGLPIAFLAFLLKDPRRERVGAHPETIIPEQGFASFLVERRGVIFFTIAGFATATFVAYAASAWTPAYFMRVHGWTAGKIGWAYGIVIATAGAIGAVLGGLLIDAVYSSGRQEATLWVAGFAALGALPPFVLAYLVSSSTLSLLLIFVAQTTVSLAGGASYAVWQKVSPARFRGRLTAIYILCASLAGTGLGPVSVGAVTDYVFADPLALGKSIALTIGVALPLMSVLFFAGSFRLRHLTD